VYHLTQSPKIAKVRLSRLRPTQISVGYAEVQIKAKQWAKLGKKRLAAELERHLFPAVIGPGGEYFIVDHHHLGIALLEQGVQTAFVAVLDDMSWLEPTVFWRTMEFRSWSHPYDARGRRRDYGDIPTTLSKLQDDPYRALAGLVRNDGGFAKDQAPFVEFLWADFFRSRVAARAIQKDPLRAARQAVRLAQSSEARYLPGWSGKIARK
jgi:hypothetical protein